MPNRPLRLLLALVGLVLSSAIPTLAVARDAEPRNRASFRVEAVREVENDWVTARLSVVAEGKQASAVADEVNTVMAQALERAKRATGVERRSGGYVTQPVYEEGRIVRWRATQDLRLESSDVEALSALIGDLQGGSVLLSGIQFSVRRETRQALEDELIAEALAAFRARADRIAAGLGEQEWSLIDVSVGTTATAPYRVQMESHNMRLRSSKAMAAPALEAGSSEIRIQASGTVELD